MVTDTARHKQDRLQYIAPLASMQCKNSVGMTNQKAGTHVGLGRTMYLEYPGICSLVKDGIPLPLNPPRLAYGDLVNSDRIFDLENTTMVKETTFK